MASRAERRRAAALFSFRGPPPQPGTRPLCGGRARARGSFAVLKWSGQSPARRRACEPCAHVASVGSGQTHPHSFRRMVFEELPLVATETTVPRGRVSSAGKLGCSCVVSLPCLPDFCALATAELGGTRGGEEGDHEEPGPHAAHCRQEEEGIPPPGALLGHCRGSCLF